MLLCTVFIPSGCIDACLKRGSPQDAVRDYTQLSCIAGKLQDTKCIHLEKYASSTRQLWCSRLQERVTRYRTISLPHIFTWAVSTSCSCMGPPPPFPHSHIGPPLIPAWLLPFSLNPSHVASYFNILLHMIQQIFGLPSLHPFLSLHCIPPSITSLHPPLHYIIASLHYIIASLPSLHYIIASSSPLHYMFDDLPTPVTSWLC